MTSRPLKKPGNFFSAGMLMAFGAGLSSCTLSTETVELRQLHPVLVSSKQTGGRTLLHLVGGVMISQGGIERISSKYSKNELRLEIVLGLKDGLSPEIDFQTLIPDSVDRVVFGRERIPIWDRAHGPLVKPTRVKASRSLPPGWPADLHQIPIYDWDAWNRRVDQAQSGK